MERDAVPAVTRSWTIAAALIGLVLLLPTLAYRIGVDQSSFAYIGGQLLQGRWPYLGTWESDYPGMMFLHALEILVFGRSVAMFRVFDILTQLVVVLLIFRITARLGSRTGGLLGVVCYGLIYTGYGPWNTAQREGFAIPWVLWGYWLCLTSERRPPARTALGIGLGLGIAALFKPTLLALAAFYLPLLGPLGPSLRLAGVGLGAAAAPAVLVVLLYAALGGLRELVEATWTYQAVYTARLRGGDSLLLHWARNTWRLGLQTKLLLVAGLPLLLRGPFSREHRMLYLGFLGAVLGVIVQGTFAGYHYLPGLAVGAVIVGILFSRVTGWIARRWPGTWTPRLELALVALIAAGAAPRYIGADTMRYLLTMHFLEPPGPGEFHIGTEFDFTESYDLASYLAASTDPEEPVQVWAYDPLVYYLAERRASSRFATTHPLVMRPPGGELTDMQRRWREEFMASVRQDRPPFVAVAQRDAWWWAPGEQTSEELLDDFPEWKSFLEQDFVLDRTIGRYLVLRRAGPRTCCPSLAASPIRCPAPPRGHPSAPLRSSSSSGRRSSGRRRGRRCWPAWSPDGSARARAWRPSSRSSGSISTLGMPSRFTRAPPPST